MFFTTKSSTSGLTMGFAHKIRVPLFATVGVLIAVAVVVTCWAVVPAWRIERLIVRLGVGDDAARSDAADALARFGPKVTNALVEELGDENAQKWAARALFKIGPESHPAIEVAMTSDTD